MDEYHTQKRQTRTLYKWEDVWKQQGRTEILLTRKREKKKKENFLKKCKRKYHFPHIQMLTEILIYLGMVVAVVLWKQEKKELFFFLYKYIFCLGIKQSYPFSKNNKQKTNPREKQKWLLSKHFFKQDMTLKKKGKKIYSLMNWGKKNCCNILSKLQIKKKKNLSPSIFAIKQEKKMQNCQSVST